MFRDFASEPEGGSFLLVFNFFLYILTRLNQALNKLLDSMIEEFVMNVFMFLLVQ